MSDKIEQLESKFKNIDEVFKDSPEDNKKAYKGILFYNSLFSALKNNLEKDIPKFSLKELLVAIFQLIIGIIALVVVIWLCTLPFTVLH